MACSSTHRCKISISDKHVLGQYFTTDPTLKIHVRDFIKNQSIRVLEPSIGQGDLVLAILDKLPTATIEKYEIDITIKLLDGVTGSEVHYQDFLTAPITEKFSTIVGNPPYVKVAGGTNLYLSFTEKCVDLLADGGELIFIVPSDFFKLTGSSRLLSSMLSVGTFTDIYHPHNEKLFTGASIDVVVYRYCKDPSLPATIMYNDELRHLQHSNGLVTFSTTDNSQYVLLTEYFDVYVGMVSGREEVFKQEKLGNLAVLNGKDKIDQYIFTSTFPTGTALVDDHLLRHKAELLGRGIRKFTENNWWEWGAIRNIEKVRANRGRPCIYMKTLTRQEEIAFEHTVMEFGGGLLMLVPKKECDLRAILSYLNSLAFREQFTFAGRFKIGHRQVSNCMIPRV